MVFSLQFRQRRNVHSFPRYGIRFVCPLAERLSRSAKQFWAEPKTCTAFPDMVFDLYAHLLNADRVQPAVSPEAKHAHFPRYGI